MPLPFAPAAVGGIIGVGALVTYCHWQGALQRSVLFLSTVKIAHLSDLHLPLSQRPSLKEIRFKRVLSFLSWQLRRRHVHLKQCLDTVMKDIQRYSPDMVALTGDMTNLGLLSEFRAARDWLVAQKLPPTLLVPGNHDALIRESAQSKTALWAPWLHDTKSGLSLLQQGPIVLIGLNSAVPTAPFMASGKVASQSLNALRTTLRQTGQAGLCRFVLLHHPPVKGLVVERKSLREYDQLHQVLQEEGAELVLHGHSHKGSLAVIPGTDIPVLGTPSASHCVQGAERAGGWNAISVCSLGDKWDITVQRRTLITDETMHDGSAYRFTPHRLSSTFSV